MDGLHCDTSIIPVLIGSPDQQAGKELTYDAAGRLSFYVAAILFREPVSRMVSTH